ncbi:hypothetical protein ATM97_07010 [Nocardia sp. MH4]|uniref:hypothetical protein n=1 Tax=Nocardia sp. MH4 TaxID=1768677 RepID=UPI001C4F64B1|nr:hypothetical protein [Nocardia sp. MH4]MBW0270762.1 hypothetical protein [Nocardia sp. MH4]
MADHTAAEVLAALDIVTGLPDTRRLRAALASLRDRVVQRADQDRAIGAAFAARRPDEATHEEWGALIRAAVEATGATITEPPPRAVEAADEITEEADRA